MKKIREILAGKNFTVINQVGVADFTRLNKRDNDGMNAYCNSSSIEEYKKGEKYKIDGDEMVVPTIDK